MASIKFNEILAQAAREGLYPNKNQKARDWFKNKIQGINFTSWETYEEDKNAYVMDRILADGIRKGKIPGKNKDFRSYYRNAAIAEGRIGDGYNTLAQDTARLENSLEIGNMYFFLYDAKHKDTLPFWDKFPLIFPCGPAKDGFYGINFHYLPFPTRAHLMDSLLNIKAGGINNKKFDKTTQIKLSYDFLQRTAASKYFKPAFKHYLDSHVESKYIYIPPAEWDIAIFLNVAQWQKKSEADVWNDSNKKLGLKTPHSRKL